MPKLKPKPLPTHVIARTLVFDADGRVLLLTRSEQDGWRPGGMDVPGGKVDEGEDYRDAAIRETYEETGIVLATNAVHICYAMTDLGYHSRLKHDVNYICLAYISRLPADAEITLSQEHSAYQWRTVDEAIDLSPGLTHQVFLQHLKTYGLFKEYWQPVEPRQPLRSVKV